MKNQFKRYRTKPANYVLWSDGLDFYVSKRVGVKRDSELREHFVSFFASERDAWKSAERRLRGTIDLLGGYIKRFRKNARASK